MAIRQDCGPCTVLIEATGATINGMPIQAADSVARFHSLFGTPTRIDPAGPPAPAGHRNNYIHFYDHLGVYLNEHHFTYQIQEVGFVLDIDEAAHPTERPFTGQLHVGGITLSPSATEDTLAESSLSFTSKLRGSWSTEIQSGLPGISIYVSIDSNGRRLPSGRRSKVRQLLSVSLGLHHDPWDTTHRPS
ncbi:hypothetical protein [Aeoliella sp.]|uniref:DUF7738 domain-containing protein n=1 Tax=Aeoliella sp. TaxID=2795800 RepID=UPI003CCBDC01